MRSNRLVVLLALFFCSGACGLVYQVLWLRQLSLVFGVTVYAASTVLAAFMSGLALGSLAAGPLLRRVRRPLFVFSLAEIGIGLSALATPVALALADGFYGALHDTVAGRPAVMTMARLVGSFVVLLVPTFLMGLTLPVVSSSSLVRGSTLGSRVSLLYAVNTAGAMTGVLLAGFYLIGGLGMRRTFLVAAAINLLVGGAALWLARSIDDRVTDTATSGGTAGAQTSTDHRAWAAVAFVVFLSGFASLALEIVWFRILLQFVPASTYAFTTMLAAVLAGIALGGAIAARHLRTDRDWLRSLSQISMATGIAAVSSIIVISWGYRGDSGARASLQTVALAILPAATCMGLALPIALRIAALRDSTGQSSTAVAQAIGRLYALNVLGAIIGAVAGGFVVLPALGSHLALILLAGLFVVAGLVLVASHPSRRGMLAGATAGVVLFSLAASAVPDPLAVAVEHRHGGARREIFRHDGPQTAVTVYANQSGRVMLLDGVHQADDTPKMVKVHATIGHLPVVLNASPRNVLVVGLGGGVTAGAVSQHPGTQVQVVELSDGVRRASDLFSHVTFDVLRRPNIRFRVDDGRNFLKFSRDQYDVVTADIIQPVHAGAGHLYSREYFTLVKNSLAPGGRFVQWIGLQREIEHYKLIMRTFVDVFPHATLWCDGDFMIGSVEPLTLARGRVAEARRDPATARALDAIGLANDDTLRSWFTGGAAEMRAFVGPGPVLTDDQPLVEYHRSVGNSQLSSNVDVLRGDVSQVLP